MRTKFNNRELCHVWANRGQDNGEGSNMYFTGPTLYSYGSHFVIGHYLNDGTLLWNTAGYSMTTSKHKSYARQAVPMHVWNKAIMIGGLNDNAVRSIDRAVREKTGANPELIQSMVDSIIADVAAIGSMRSVSKMESALEHCRSVQDAAKRLCAMVSGKTKKTTLVYPLPDMPAELPVDKETRLAWVRSIAKSKHIADSAQHESIARRVLSELGSAAADPEGVNTWAIQNLLGRLNTGLAAAKKAQDFHALAHAKQSAKLSKLAKDLGKLEIPLTEIVDAWRTKQAQTALQMIVRDVYGHFRKTRKDSVKMESRFSRSREAGYFLSKLDEVRRALPADEWAQWDALHMRLGRANQWDVSVNSHHSAVSAKEGADSYYPLHMRDALSSYKQAAGYSQSSSAHDWHIEFAGSPMGQKSAAIHAESIARIAELKAQLAIKNAESLGKWLSGESNSLPAFGGTYARIRGDVVETTMRATVPIEHACRLARIARRVIAAGGRQWLNDDGPMVGHYRVRSIGADGSAVIGCHEFDAAEGLRLLSVLESCEACAEHVVHIEA